MKMQLYRIITLTVISVIFVLLPVLAQKDELRISDQLLQNGNYLFHRDLFMPALAVQPDNPPAGTVFRKLDPLFRSQIELQYTGDRFVRRMTDSQNGSVIEESSDGIYFCLLSLPPKDETTTNPHITIERKGKLYNDAFHPMARFVTVHPGAMLFQGRGLSFLRPNITPKNGRASFPMSGLTASAVFDAAHSNVLQSLSLINDKKKVDSEFVMTKPVRLRFGVWVASDTIQRSFDSSGKVDTWMRVRLIEEKPLDTNQSYSPAIKKGYVVSFNLEDGQEVVFKKTGDKPLTLPELEALARKKAPQDKRLLSAINNSDAKQKKQGQIKQATQLVSVILAVVVAGLIILLVRARLRKP